ncbi:MAG: GNAT family N-acetyltransferase [Bacteroidota bacterium]
MRPFQISDAAEMLSLNADPEVMRFVPDKPFEDLLEAKRFLQHYDAWKHGFGRWAVIRREDGAWLGWCGLRKSPRTGLVDLGFRFHRKYWGNGYATEAGRASLKWGFGEPGLPCLLVQGSQVQIESSRRSSDIKSVGLHQSGVIARTMPANLASQQVLIKLGFEMIGEFEDQEWSGRLYRTFSA